MFGAEYHIIEGYGCDQCRNGPADGNCCPDPIRYWLHRTDAGRVLLFSSWPTSQTPRRCERHDIAFDGRSCWICLFGPVTAEELPSGKSVELPDAATAPKRGPSGVRRVDEYRILRAKGCAACRTCATEGKCCGDPIRYTSTTRIIDGKPVDIDYTPWPTTGTPYWCDVHRSASSRPLCLDCELGIPPENTPAQLEREALMARLRAECEAERTKTTGGMTAQHEETDMAAKKTSKKTTKQSPKTHAAKAGPKPREKGPADRTGMVQEELDDETLEQLGKQLAHETLDLERLVDKKKHLCKALNSDIRGKEEAISELAEQVETGKRWVSAQGTIPGTEAAE